MKWKLIISEEYAPSDMNVISEVINGGSSNKRYTPTENFLKSSYCIINKLLFKNKLPINPDFRFIMMETPKKHYPGKTNITVKRNGEVRVDEIELNSSIMLTLHEWIEVIVHEMIHVQESIEHPEHLASEDYDPHGEWFMKRANDFTKYGLTITKFFNGNFDTSVDSDSVKNAYNDEMILQIDATESGIPMIIKILKQDKDSILDKLRDMDYDKVIVLHTDNLNSTRLKLTGVRDSDDLIVYYLKPKLKSKIGPLHEVETIDLNKIVNEGVSLIHDESEFVEISGEDEDGIHISVY